LFLTFFLFINYTRHPLGFVQSKYPKSEQPCPNVADCIKHGDSSLPSIEQHNSITANVVVVVVVLLVLVVVVVLLLLVLVVVVVGKDPQLTVVPEIPIMEAVLNLQGVSGAQSTGYESMNIKSVYEVPDRIVLLLVV
jgi:hypothetical protein